MNDNQIEKTYQYAKVKVNKVDDLSWIKSILGDLLLEDKVGYKECFNLYKSLCEQIG